MAQTFNTINATDTLASSLTPLLDRDEAAASCFSGTAFPSTNLLVGMLCYRTDQDKIYMLHSTGPSVWLLLFDLTSLTPTATYAAGVDWFDVDNTPTDLANYGITDGLKKTGDTTTGKISFVAVSSTSASIRLVPGTVEPSSPANGDMWVVNASGVRVQYNGSIYTLSTIEKAETYSAKKTFAAGTGADPSFNVPPGSAPTTPADGDVWYHLIDHSFRVRLNGASRRMAWWDSNQYVQVAHGGTEAGDAPTARANLDAAYVGGYTTVNYGGGNRTFAAGDEGSLQVHNGTGNPVYTIPANATWAALVGTKITMGTTNTGHITVAIGGTDTLVSLGGLTQIKASGGRAVAEKVDTTTWLLSGDLE